LPGHALLTALNVSKSACDRFELPAALWCFAYVCVRSKLLLKVLRERTRIQVELEKLQRLSIMINKLMQICEHTQRGFYTEWSHLLVGVRQAPAAALVLHRTIHNPYIPRWHCPCRPGPWLRPRTRTRLNQSPHIRSHDNNCSRSQCNKSHSVTVHKAFIKPRACHETSHYALPIAYARRYAVSTANCLHARTRANAAERTSSQASKQCRSR
jgi:hypothetical protein